MIYAGSNVRARSREEDGADSLDGGGVDSASDLDPPTTVDGC